MQTLKKSESVYQHLKKAALYMAEKVGSHGLCLLLDGDWTDPVNGAGRLGRGESTWNTFATIYAIRLLSSISPDAELDSALEKLSKSVNEHAWNEDRYVAGFDDNDKPFGAKNDAEASLFLNAQTWALISGAVPKERIPLVRASIESLATPFGYLLLDPPFSAWNSTWGRISIKQKGTTENGSVYCHATMFKSLADVLCGDSEAALDAIFKTLPTNSENPPENHLQLPAFVPNYYFGINNSNYGMSSNHYSTGTCAWMILVLIKYIYKIEVSGNNVTANTDVPAKLKGSTVTLNIKGKTHTFNF